MVFNDLVLGRGLRPRFEVLNPADKTAMQGCGRTVRSTRSHGRFVGRIQDLKTGPRKTTSLEEANRSESELPLAAFFVLARASRLIMGMSHVPAVAGNAHRFHTASFQKS